MSGTGTDPKMQRLRLLSYRPTTDNEHVDALLCVLLELEELQSEFEDTLDEKYGARATALAILERERGQLSEKLSAWIAKALDFQIAAIYYQAFSLLHHDKPVGFLFAKMLCDDLNIGAARVMKILEHLPEDDEAREHLERVAAEEGQFGGG